MRWPLKIVLIAIAFLAEMTGLGLILDALLQPGPTLWT